MNKAAVTKIQALIVIAILIVAVIGIIYYLTLPSPEPEVIKLKEMNIAYDVEYIQEKIAIFNEAHPGIEVEYVPLADYYTAIVTIFTTTPSAVDIVRTNPGYMAPWVTAGWITDLEGLPGLEELKADMMPAFKGDFMYDGKFYGLSGGAYLRTLIYNKRLLDAAGIDHPPETLDELVEQSLTIKSKGVCEYPIAFPLITGERRIDWAWYHTAIMMGDETLYDENWEPTYLTEDSLGYKALDWIAKGVNEWEIMDPASVEWDGFACIQRVQTGDAVFCFYGPYYGITCNDPDISPEAGNIYLCLMPGKWSWVKADTSSITKACREKGDDYFQAAWEYLQWRQGPAEDGYGYMQALDGKGSMPTVWDSMNADPDIRAGWAQSMHGDDMAIMDEQLNWIRSLQYYSPAHKTGFYLEWVYDYCLSNLQKAVIKQLTVQEALNAIDAGFQKLADEYGLPPRGEPI